MTHLVYVRSPRGHLSPQKIYGSEGTKPFLDEGIRRDVERTFTIAPEHEDAALDELAALYPATTQETRK